MKRRRKRSNGDPFWLTARYPGKCSCGFEIKPGQQIFWYPNDRRTICQKCGHTAELAVTRAYLNKILVAMRQTKKKRPSRSLR